MEYKDIYEKIWKIIEKIKGLQINDRDMLEPLTGRKYDMDAVDMVYLVLEIQNNFNLTLLNVDFEAYKFISVDGIVKIIKEKMDYY